MWRFEDLAYQVFFQREVVSAYCEQGQDIVGVDGGEEVEEGAVFEEFCGEACVWPKQ